MMDKFQENNFADWNPHVLYSIATHYCLLWAKENLASPHPFFSAWWKVSGTI
jgi:hypothetical protein